MDWVIKQLNVKKDLRIRHADINNYKSEYKKLKFCEICKRSWEILTTGIVASYSHLPTYGLYRESCKVCNNNNVSYKQKKREKNE